MEIVTIEIHFVRIPCSIIMHTESLS